MDRVKSIFSNNSASKYEVSEWLKEDDKLMSYVKKRNLEKVQSMVKKGTVVTKIDPGLSHSCLAQACRDGDISIVKALSQASNIDIDARDSAGRTGLHHAIICGRKEVAQYLIWVGASTKLVDYQRNSSMHHAVICGHFDCVTLLTEQQADVDQSDKTGQTPLILSCIKGQATIARILLQNKANINHREMNGRTPLITASMYGHAALCSYLLSNGADKTIVDNKGHNALWHAIDKERSDVRKILEETQSKPAVLTRATDDMSNYQTAENSRTSTPLITANLHEVFLRETTPVPDSEHYESIDEYSNREEIGIISNTQQGLHAPVPYPGAKDIQKAEATMTSTSEIEEITDDDFVIAILKQNNDSAFVDINEDGKEDVLHAGQIIKIEDESRKSFIYSKVTSSTSSVKCSNCERLENDIERIKSELNRNVQIISICENCEKMKTELLAKQFKSKHLMRQLRRLQFDIVKMHEKAMSEKDGCRNHVNDLLMISGALNDVYNCKDDESSSDDEYVDDKDAYVKIRYKENKLSRKDLEDKMQELQHENNLPKVKIIESEKEIRKLNSSDNSVLAKKYKYLQSKIDFNEPDDLISYVTDSLEEISRLNDQNKKLEFLVKCNLDDYNKAFEDSDKQINLMVKKLDRLDECVKENYSLKEEVNHLREAISAKPLKPETVAKVKGVERSRSVDLKNDLGQKQTEKDVYAVNFEQVKRLFLLNKSYFQEKSVNTEESSMKQPNEVDSIRLQNDLKRKEMQVEHLQHQCENYGKLSTRYDIINIEYTNVIASNKQLKNQNETLKQQINSLIDEARASISYNFKSVDAHAPNINKDSDKDANVGILVADANRDQNVNIENEIIKPRAELKTKSRVTENGFPENYKLGEVATERDILRDNMNVFKKLLIHNRISIGETDRNMKETAAEQTNLIKDIEENILRISELTDRLKDYSKLSDENHILINEMNHFRLLFAQIEKSLYDLQLRSDLDSVKYRLHDYVSTQEDIPANEEVILKEVLKTESALSSENLLTSGDGDSDRRVNTVNIYEELLHENKIQMFKLRYLQDKLKDYEQENVLLKKQINPNSNVNSFSRSDSDMSKDSSKDDQFNTNKLVLPAFFNLLANKFSMNKESPENKTSDFDKPVNDELIKSSDMDSLKQSIPKVECNTFEADKKEINVNDREGQLSSSKSYVSVIEEFIVPVIIKRNSTNFKSKFKEQDFNEDNDLSKNDNCLKGTSLENYKNNTLLEVSDDTEATEKEPDLIIGILLKENKDLTLKIKELQDVLEETEKDIENAKVVDIKVNNLEVKLKDYGKMATENQILKNENGTLYNLLKNKDVTIIDKNEEISPTNNNRVEQNNLDNLLIIRERDDNIKLLKNQLDDYGLLKTEKKKLEIENNHLSQLLKNQPEIKPGVDIYDVEQPKLNEDLINLQENNNQLTIKIKELNKENINCRRELENYGILLTENYLLKREIEDLKRINLYTVEIHQKDNIKNELTGTVSHTENSFKISENALNAELLIKEEKIDHLEKQLKDFGIICAEKDLFKSELEKVQLILRSKNQQVEINNLVKGQSEDKAREAHDVDIILAKELKKVKDHNAKLERQLLDYGLVISEKDLLKKEVVHLKRMVTDYKIPEYIEKDGTPLHVDRIDDKTDKLTIRLEEKEKEIEILEVSLFDLGRLSIENDILKAEVDRLQKLVRANENVLIYNDDDMENDQEEELVKPTKVSAVEAIRPLETDNNSDQIDYQKLIFDLENKLKDYGSMATERDLLKLEVKELRDFFHDNKLVGVARIHDNESIEHTNNSLNKQIFDLESNIVLRDTKIRELEKQLENYGSLMTQRDLLLKDIEHYKSANNLDKSLYKTKKKKVPTATLR